MEIEEFSERIIALGKGLNALCDDLYSATQGETDRQLGWPHK